MAINSNIPETEQQLVSALQSKDTEAFKRLYQMYSGALLGVIQRVVQQTELAEDILQECFVKIWNSSQHYDASKGRLFTWMMNIARNLAIDKTRSKDFKNANKNQDIDNNVSLIDAQKQAAYNADVLGLKTLVNELKPDLKTVLDMVYFKGYTQAEVAEELDIPLGTIKTRVRAAVLALRKKFN